MVLVLKFLVVNIYQLVDRILFSFEKPRLSDRLNLVCLVSILFFLLIKVAMVCDCHKISPLSPNSVCHCSNHAITTFTKFCLFIMTISTDMDANYILTGKGQ